MSIEIFKTDKNSSPLTSLNFDSEFFDVESTLLCGQIFTFKKCGKGYYITLSHDTACYAQTDGDKTTVVFYPSARAESDIRAFFDVDTDYKAINAFATAQGSDALTAAAKYGKGIRILRQNPFIAFVCFIISQNNNISRITKTVSELCRLYGKKVLFDGDEVYLFPTADDLSRLSVDDYRALGCGYRSEYLYCALHDFDKEKFSLLTKQSNSTNELRRLLLSYKGVGKKVADCVLLFGLGKTDSFPVDTWIYKVYKQDFCGKQTTAEGASAELADRFKNLSGYVQQYLFYYKRNVLGGR